MKKSENFEQKIPKLGLGTYKLEENEKTIDFIYDLIVNHDLKLIDTAKVYDTE